MASPLLSRGLYSAVKAIVQKETPANQKADSAPSAEVLTNCQNLAELVANTDSLAVVANCDHLGPPILLGLRRGCSEKGQPESSHNL